MVDATEFSSPLMMGGGGESRVNVDLMEEIVDGIVDDGEKTRVVKKQMKAVVGDLELVLGELKTVMDDLKSLVGQIDVVTNKLHDEQGESGVRRSSTSVLERRPPQEMADPDLKGRPRVNHSKSMSCSLALPLFQTGRSPVPGPSRAALADLMGPPRSSYRARAGSKDDIRSAPVGKDRSLTVTTGNDDQKQDSNIRKSKSAGALMKKPGRQLKPRNEKDQVPEIAGAGRNERAREREGSRDYSHKTRLVRQDPVISSPDKDSSEIHVIVDENYIMTQFMNSSPSNSDHYSDHYSDRYSDISAREWKRNYVGLRHQVPGDEGHSPTPPALRPRDIWTTAGFPHHASTEVTPAGDTGYMTDSSLTPNEVNDDAIDDVLGPLVGRSPKQPPSYSGLYEKDMEDKLELELNDNIDLLDTLTDIHTVDDDDSPQSELPEHFDVDLDLWAASNEWNYPHSRDDYIRAGTPPIRVGPWRKGSAKQKKLLETYSFNSSSEDRLSDTMGTDPETRDMGMLPRTLNTSIVNYSWRTVVEP